MGKMVVEPGENLIFASD